MMKMDTSYIALATYCKIDVCDLCSYVLQVITSPTTTYQACYSIINIFNLILAWIPSAISLDRVNARLIFLSNLHLHRRSGISNSASDH